jgi:hypothetical protein
MKDLKEIFTWAFRGIIASMFVIIMGLIGFIANSMATQIRTIDANMANTSGHLSKIDVRLAVIEERLKIPAR